MGIFWEPVKPVPRAQTVAAFRSALEAEPASIKDTQREAEKRADKYAPTKGQTFNAGRFIGALVIFAVIAGAAVATDATDLGNSSKALWGFAATIFGVVVGLLGGEKSA